jgi:hypothetical protein
MTRFGAALLALVLVGSSVAGADDWPAARVFVVFSDNGRYFVRFVPGESVGDTVGFSGAPKGKYATALLYALQADRGYRLQHEVTLTNPVSPLAALVADDGAFITLDNWHNVGFGKVAAIYSVSSRYWRCRPVHFVDPKDQKAVYVPEALGGYFVFTLATGGVVRTPGTRKECHPPESPMSWSTLGR